jgi:hypothetical protein
MFSGWLRYLQLTAKARTGFGRSVVVYAAVAAVFACTAFAFLVIAAFVALADLYGVLTAALVMGAFFLLGAILASLFGVLAQRRSAERAKIALEARKASQWFDPRMLAAGLQIGRAIGLRRIIPLIAVGLLVATVVKEWLGPERQDGAEEGEGSADDGEG